MRILLASLFVCFSAQFVVAQTPPPSFGDFTWDIFDGATGKDTGFDVVPGAESEDGNSIEMTVFKPDGNVLETGTAVQVTPGVWRVSVHNTEIVVTYEWSGTAYRKVDGSNVQRELRPKP